MSKLIKIWMESKGIINKSEYFYISRVDFISLSNTNTIYFALEQ